LENIQKRIKKINLKITLNYTAKDIGSIINKKLEQEAKAKYAMFTIQNLQKENNL
jgi:hypothetical protein